METLTEKDTIKPKHKGTKILFQNPILERLTRTHIAVPVIMFVVVAISLLAYAFLYTNLNPMIIISIFMVGLILFTLVEYLVHRYLFHMEHDTPLKEKIQYNVHGIHHEYPKDKDRLAMPPLISATIAVVLFFSFRLLLGEFVFAFLPGFVLGYAAYLAVHYIVHAYQPPKNVFKFLWVNHGIHHYKNGESAFGVSSPLWDYIFKTMP